MNTYTRDQNKLDAEAAQRYDIEAGAMMMPEMSIKVATRRVELGDQHVALLKYLTSKVTAQDWHAVADAAMDLREIDAKIDELNRV